MHRDCELELANFGPGGFDGLPDLWFIIAMDDGLTRRKILADDDLFRAEFDFL